MTIATAGHIDHGKSALVEALTGVHPDRLPEEKRRGITLDLGFGHWLEDGEPVGVVDVPGHEGLVRTMIAGAAGVDAVLLVVAANEGVQPQTVEHCDICRLLGLDQAVIALSKCDLAGAAQRAAARAQVAALLAGTAWQRAPVLAVSAATGEGVAGLRAALRQAAAAAPPRNLDAPLRLPIDRSFTLKGFGTVVTGTLLAGRLCPQDEVVVEPLGRRLRVRGVQVHGRPATAAHAGQRTAVNLVGVEAGELRRGMVVLAPGAAAPTAEWLAEIELLPHAALRGGDRVVFHLGTADRLGRARAGRVRLEAPVVAAAGDRFIVRQLSPARTLGGGRVLDPHPAARRARPPSPPAAPPPPAAAPDQALRAAVEDRLRGFGLAAPPPPALLAGLAPGARAALAALARDNIAIECQPGWFLHRDALGDLRRRLAELAAAPGFSVGDFKQWTGLTRARAIPLLEYLDRRRVTRRDGDLRRLAD